MEKLWAPWRMSYVTVPKAEGCVFCNAPDAADPREQLVLYRGETCYVIMNLFPYNNGHLMVAPYRHTADLARLTVDEQNELMELTRYALLVLQESFQPDGFNLGMNLGRVAGSGIADHLHQHLVPRWNGDTNFMPVIGETKVLPDALYAGYDRLRATVERLGPPSVALARGE